MRNKSLILVVLLILFSSTTLSAVTTLGKGVTLGGWLSTDEAYYIQTTRYTQKDFSDVLSMGCDHVRIPVNFFTSALSAPDYEVSPIQIGCLDKAVAWATDLGLKVVIVNIGPDELKDSNIAAMQDQMVQAWKSVASHFSGTGTDAVLYEIYDSPGDTLDAAAWKAAAVAIAAGIREVDNTHTIIIGAVNFYDIDGLAGLGKLTDDNILYAFDMFDPPIFTYQGASYRNIDYNTFVVPFPYNIAKYPAMNALDAGTPSETAYGAYTDQGTVAFVQGRIDAAAQFAMDNGVLVYCASFGSTIGANYSYTYETGWHVLEEYRVAWLEAVRAQCEAKGIPWCLSSFRGNFGIFNNYDQDPERWMGFDSFPYDVNGGIVTALGLTPPAAEVYVPEALDEGFTLYDDEVNPLARVGFWLGDGEPDFFNTEDPLSGQYCMGIFYPGQWNAVDLFFTNYLDMEILAEADFMLDFWLRCDNEEGHIQARFEDTNEDLEERPWRFNYHIDNSVVPFDGDWQRVLLPLTEMQDQGAWDPDDRTWYGAEGLQDWAAVQRLQFVSETEPQPDTEIYLDRIRIVDESAVGGEPANLPAELALSPNFPNPFNPATSIHFSLPERTDVTMSIFNLRGELVKQLTSGTRDAGEHSVVWDGTNMANQNSASGIYIYRLETADRTLTNRMVLIR